MPVIATKSVIKFAGDNFLYYLCKRKLKEGICKEIYVTKNGRFL